LCFRKKQFYLKPNAYGYILQALCSQKKNPYYMDEVGFAVFEQIKADKNLGRRTFSDALRFFQHHRRVTEITQVSSLIKNCITLSQIADLFDSMFPRYHAVSLDLVRSFISFSFSKISPKPTLHVNQNPMLGQHITLIGVILH
jgi:hypothetical protein